MLEEHLAWPLLRPLRELFLRDNTCGVEIAFQVIAIVRRLLHLVGSGARHTRLAHDAPITSDWLHRKPICCLLLLYLHETECVEVCIRLFIVRVNMNLWVGRLADSLFRSNHHRPLHARVRDVRHDIEHYKCLFELNNLLIDCLVEIFVLGYYHGRFDSILVVLMSVAWERSLSQRLINFLEYRKLHRLQLLL